MLENLKHSAGKIGLPPGTLIKTKDSKLGDMVITLLKYNEESCEKILIDDIIKIPSYLDPNYKFWIKIKGLIEPESIKIIGKMFNVSSLTLEDIMHNFFNAKIEFFENYILLILKSTLYNDKENTIENEQISLIIGSNYLISFEDTDNTSFDVVEERLKNNSLFRKRQSDYLGYSLLDLIIDMQFDTLKNIAEKIEDIDRQIINNSNSFIISQINDLKELILYITSYVRSLKKLVNSFEKEDTDLINSYLSVYLRDLRDHVIQLSESTEICRERVTHLMDFYLSIANYRMSEVMKVLTIIATIFIPLGFIAGVYGMNFKYMPELDWHYGYFTVLGLMLFFFLASMIFFKFKKWI